MDTEDAGGIASLEALGLGEPSSLTPPAKGAWRGKAVFLGVLPVAVIAVLASGLAMGQAILFPQTRMDGLGPNGPKGRCFVLDQHWCSSLDVHYVERLAGVEFPPNADVIDSGSSWSLKSGREWAMVRWPEGTTIPDAPTSGIPIRGVVANGDFARIDAEWHVNETSDYSSTIKLGLGTDGRPRLTVERVWDG